MYDTIMHTAQQLECYISTHESTHTSPKGTGELWCVLYELCTQKMTVIYRERTVPHLLILLNKSIGIAYSLGGLLGPFCWNGTQLGSSEGVSLLVQAKDRRRGACMVSVHRYKFEPEYVYIRLEMLSGTSAKRNILTKSAKRNNFHEKIRDSRRWAPGLGQIPDLWVLSTNIWIMCECEYDYLIITWVRVRVMVDEY